MYYSCKQDHFKWIRRFLANHLTPSLADPFLYHDETLELMTHRWTKLQKVRTKALLWEKKYSTILDGLRLFYSTAFSLQQQKVSSPLSWIKELSVKQISVVERNDLFCLERNNHETKCPNTFWNGLFVRLFKNLSFAVWWLPCEPRPDKLFAVLFTGF